VVKPIKDDSLRQEHTCGILQKFGDRTLKALWVSPTFIIILERSVAVAR